MAAHKSTNSHSMTPTPHMQMRTPKSEVVTPTTAKSMATKNPLRLVTTRTEDRHSVLPSYYSTSPVADHVVPSPTNNRPPSSHYSRITACQRKSIFTKPFNPFAKNRQSTAPPLPMNITGPLNTNPQFAHLIKRPDSALHPSRKGGDGETYRFRA